MRRTTTVALLLLLAAPLAVAQDSLPSPEAPAEPATEPVTEPKTDPLTDLMRRVNNLEGELKKEKERQKAKVADAAKKPTVNWMMQIQTDGIWADQDADNRAAVGPIPDGVAFRRARFGMFGDHGPWEYRIAMDFALSGRPSFIDVYVALNDVPVLNRVKVGHFFEPFGLEHYSQNRFITFLERPLTSEVLGQPRNMGVMANGTWAGERATWAGGVFSTDSDPYGDDPGFDFRPALTGRVTGLAWYDEATEGRDLLHLGGSYSARAAKADIVRYRSRPEIRIGSAVPNIPDFVDTGNIRTDFYQWLNAELLWIRGPFSVQGEYQLMPVSTADRGAAYFHTWYAMASVFLTGENRAYRKRTGVLERLVPRRDFLRKEGGGLAVGPGAWELAFRVSRLDLDAGGIRGGRLTDLTFGVNWYMTPFVRMTANYIRALQTPGRGSPGAADLYGVRLGYEF